MNVERLLKVKQQILKYPEETDMEKTHDRKGRCHCIFGWAQVLFSPRFLDRFWRGRFVKNAIDEQELFGLLGMTYAEARPLFHAMLWPDDLRSLYYTARTKKFAAQVTAAAIDRFIAKPGFKK